MLGLPQVAVAQTSPPPAMELAAEVEGATLRVSGMLPRGVPVYEVRIASDRNTDVSRYTDVSPDDKQQASRKEKFDALVADFWYPVVDVRLEPGMEAVALFPDGADGTYLFGGPFFTDRQPLARRVVVPASRLEHWENSLLVDPAEGNELRGFYLKKEYPFLLRQFEHTFELLSEDWSGTVAIAAEIDGEDVVLAEREVAAPKTAWADSALTKHRGTGITRERLAAALEALVRDGLRRQNDDPHSPTYGALHTFYDLEARTYRTSHWLWASAPFVKLVLDAGALPEIQRRFSADSLRRAVEQIGRLHLRYQLREAGHPADGFMHVIWTGRNPDRDDGYEQWIGTSDTGMIMRWALVPLFEATGDSVYLHAAERWAREQERLIAEFPDIIPHRFLYDLDEWSPSILDETGWDPEGHAALYRVTGEERYREIGRAYMDPHLEKFQLENGLWNRRWDMEAEEAAPPSKMVRGLGWAMEGLLAMNRMYPDTLYLDYARRLAEHLVDSQLPSGAWAFVFDRPPEEVGITEKGTAFWSLMFYQLYEATGEARYLDAARNALRWCLENQYAGPDPEAIGGLVGQTNASMVGYRYFYPATCAYTTGFFGLALLEELRLMEAGRP